MPRTVRLVFFYEGIDVRLVSRQTVEMVPPPSDPFQGKEGQTGFWYELRDQKDRTLYRRIAQDPLRPAAEIRSDSPDRPLAWQKVDSPKGEFVLMIPERPAGRYLVLFRSPDSAAASAAKELVRFDLSKSPEEERSNEQQ